MKWGRLTVSSSNDSTTDAEFQNEWWLIVPQGPVKAFSPSTSLLSKTFGINGSLQTPSHMEIFRNVLNSFNFRKAKKMVKLKKNPFDSWYALWGSYILFELWQGWYMNLLRTRTYMDLAWIVFTSVLYSFKEKQILLIVKMSWTLKPFKRLICYGIFRLYAEF